MKVAIFWRQLLIQIAVANSVAYQKNKFKLAIAGCRFEKNPVIIV